MHALRLHLRRWTWLALLAMGGLALVPTVSHALAAFDGTRNAWAEVCSAVGGLRSGLAVGPFAADGVDGRGLLSAFDGPTDGGRVAASFDHCPLCSSAGGQPPLPTSDLTLPLRADGADFVPLLFDAAPRPLFAWAAVQARAPPSTV